MISDRKHEWAFRLFRRYAKRYVARSFCAVRLARGGPVPRVPEGPVIVVVNHPSWWDPLIGLVLSERWPGRNHFAPIASEMLERYRFFARLGFFGVEADAVQGGRTFLRMALAVARKPGAMLWITAQGRFADARQRPVELKRGVGHLVRRLDRGSVVPLALEYPFWNQRTPEALARFGPPLVIESRRSFSAGAWTERIALALQAAQDALAVEAMRRDPSDFEVLLPGVVGVGGVYDLWRGFRAALRGERFRPEHGSDDAGSGIRSDG